jgi:Arm DNA-binding domain
MAKVLTAAAVERLRPKEKRLEIADGGCAGLYLIVQPSGAKSWALRFRRPSGKTAKLTLGTVDLADKETDGEPVTGAPLSLAAARRLATELHHQRARGNDVVAARRRERLERQAHNERTFAAAALDFVRQHAQGRLRRWQERARILGVREAERWPGADPEGAGGSLARSAPRGDRRRRRPPRSRRSARARHSRLGEAHPRSDRVTGAARVRGPEQVL